MSAGAIQPGTAVAFGLFLLVGLVIPGLLVWRDIRQERRRLAAPVPPAPTFTAYLSTLSGRLGFVPAQNEEVCAEIEAHLGTRPRRWWRTASIVADAKRKAMDQLGSPADLAIALRDARRERPQALAIVGGAAMQAGDGFIRGGCAGLVAVGIGLAIGSRQAVTAIARIAQRPVGPIARTWALAVSPMIAWATIFSVAWSPAWPFVPFAVSLPVAAALGALHDPWAWWRRIPIRRRVGTLAAVSLVVIAVEVAFARYEGISSSGEVLAIELTAPLAPAWSIPRTTDYLDRASMDADCDEDSGVASCRFTIRDEWNPGGRVSGVFSDLRLEVWPAHGRSYDPVGIDPRASAPVLTGEVTLKKNAIVGEIGIGMRRDGPQWWLV